MTDDIQNTKLNWAAIKEAGVAPGLVPFTSPIDDAPMKAVPHGPARESEVAARISLSSGVQS
jgi:hypothetical protein